MTKRFGIVGCGNVAHIHGWALARLNGATLAGCCDVSADAAGAFAAKHGGKAYADVEALVKEVDGVIVCTPQKHHAAGAVTALDAGKFAVVEKPLAGTLEDCDRILAASQKSGAPLAVMCQRRNLAPVQRIYQARQSGKLGEPVLITASMYGWRSSEYYQQQSADGVQWRGKIDQCDGLGFNQAPHHSDLILSLMGPVKRVSAVVANVNHSEIEAEDTIVASVLFENGGVGSITFTNAMKPGYYAGLNLTDGNGNNVSVKTDGVMFVAGSDGMADAPVLDAWNVDGDEEALAEMVDEDTRAFRALDKEHGEGGSTNFFHLVALKDICTALNADEPMPVTGDDGRRVVELLTACYLSSADGVAIDCPLTPQMDRDDFEGRQAIYRVDSEVPA